jgi:hypothetical protein
VLRLKSAADLLKSQIPLKYLAGFLVILVIATSCAGDEASPLVHGSDYLPLQTGFFHVYAVQETIYSNGSEPLTLNYEIRTEVIDSFPSGNDQYTYVIHRSKRDPGSDLWQPLDTWSARQQPNEWVITEGNTSYVKIKLPLTLENVWNGNAFNSRGSDEFRYTDVASPLEINGIPFESTLTVEQEENDDVIVFRDERKEIYALHVGLVYKEIIQLNYCTADACLGQQKVDHGVEMKMTISAYGKE